MLIKKGHMVFCPDDPIVIRSMFPESKRIELGDKVYVAVKHTLEAVTLLRNLGIHAPSPINYGWKYPGRYSPFNHQRETTDFLTTTRRGFVFSGVGSGKSKCALWSAEYLIQQGIVNRVLIVCPKSCTNKVWMDEIFQTLMHRVAIVCEGSRERKREAAMSTAQFVIINHDGVASIQDLIIKHNLFDLIIYDEAAVLRNAQTMRYKKFKAILKPATRLWLLTATPCPNDPTDAWALAKLVRPENVTPYFSAFKRQVMLQVSSFKWVPKPDAFKMAYDVMQPAIRFKTEECIDLPPITYQNRNCEMSVEQKRMFDEMKRTFVADGDGGTITAVNAAVKLIKLLQISLGCVYDDTGAVQELDSSDRVNTLNEIIEESDRKVIVWVPFKHTMLSLKTEISKKWKCEIVNGDTSSTERTRIFTEFQREDSDLKVLIAHPKTAAHGLTLVSANVAVWYGPTFSAELKLQADGRINRPGQKHHMSIIHLGSSAMEWEAYEVAKGKADGQQKVLDLYKKLLTS